MRCLRCVESAGDVFCAGHNGVYSRYAADMPDSEAMAATKAVGRFTAARKLEFRPLLHQLALTQAIVRGKLIAAFNADDFVASGAD